MKLSELKSEGGNSAAAVVAPTGSSEAPGPEAPAVAAVEPSPSEPFEHETVTTPSGIEVLYSWAPKRLYRLRHAGPHVLTDIGIRCDDPSSHLWTEVPSVTTVLGVLDKSGPLVWWAQRIGIEGVLELIRRNLWYPEPELKMFTPDGLSAELVALLTEHKLSVNHVKDAAADRGVNVHDVLEEWVASLKRQPGGILPKSFNTWPEHERGYVEGLCRFLETIALTCPEAESELMVGSLQHQYAGRFDLVLTLSKPVDVVTRHYPKRKAKVEEIPAGRYLLDLKTSKRVYDTHFLQLEAYEKASVECGYEPTDYRGVVHVTADGKYELCLNEGWTFEDFAVIRQAYSVMHERESLKNEREVEQTLRDELGAKDIS